jgi:hypothetical protein
VPKLKHFTSNSAYGDHGEGWNHYCPACKTTHGFAVESPFRNGARWSFDGNMEAPTFSPSMNIRVGPYPYDPAETDHGRIEVCHYFLRGGVIEYLGDCTHEMRGQRVPLPDLPLGR